MSNSLAGEGKRIYRRKSLHRNRSVILGVPRICRKFHVMIALDLGMRPAEERLEKDDDTLGSI
jgi:hypothetical protein